jgi:arginase
MRTFGVISIPSSAGARNVGQELAPQALRSAGLFEELKKGNVKVVDCGSTPLVRFEPDRSNPNAQNLPLVAAVARKTMSRVANAVQSNLFPFVIGGDCTITLGVVAGMTEPGENLGLVYFDADVDLNTPDDTPSGIFDGMGMSHMLGEGAPELSRMGSRYPLLDKQRIAMFGVNMSSGSVDPHELDRFNSRDFIKTSVEEIRVNPEETARKALAALEKTADRILVHFDVDVLDHQDFPCADVPHNNGLTLQEAVRALKIFFASNKFGGFVLTEFNAQRDMDGSNARKLVRSLCEVMKGAQ